MIKAQHFSKLRLHYQRENHQERLTDHGKQGLEGCQGLFRKVPSLYQCATKQYLCRLAVIVPIGGRGVVLPGTLKLPGRPLTEDAA